jgi:trk system potassium uptake protein TrkH
MGLVVIAVAMISRLTEGGKRMMVGETGRDEELRLFSRLSHVARALFTVYLILNFVFFVLFLLSIHYSGLKLDWSTSAFHALVHAMTSISTGGYSSLTNSIAGFESTYVSVVAIGSMIAGGFSFPLYIRLWRGNWASVFRMAGVKLYLVLIAVPALLISLRLVQQGLAWDDGLLHGTFMSISSLVGEGFTTTDAGTFPSDVRMLLVILMVVGGMVGSTSGAIKQARILIIFRLIATELQRLLHPRAVIAVRASGAVIPMRQVDRIAVFTILYLMFMAGGTFFFALLGFDIESAASGSAATLGNVGFSWFGFAGGYADPVTPLARLGGIVLMWFGRLEIFAAMVLFIPGTYRK